MAVAYKVLGQSSPAATTNTTLYTVPSATQAIMSSLVVCNRDTSSATFRVAIRPAGATLANSHYIVYDNTIGGNETVAFTLGLTAGATDVVTVYASNTALTFSVYGSEIT